MFASVWSVVPASFAATDPPAGSWVWPVSGRVVRGYEPPPSPYASGHRGIDIEAAFGTPVRAPAAGIVTFAGPVVGSLYVTIDHGDGYRSTSAFLSQILVHHGDTVAAGDVIALSGRGHPEIAEPHLHFGVRLNGEYVDPIPLLLPQDVVDLIRLAPLDESGSAEVLEPGPITPVFLSAFLARERLATGIVGRPPRMGTFGRAGAPLANRSRAA
jgi:murein DD-endopeptidase MepM/ murein hydrolase activator NlpD